MELKTLNAADFDPQNIETAAKFPKEIGSGQSGYEYEKTVLLRNIPFMIYKGSAQRYAIRPDDFNKPFDQQEFQNSFGILDDLFSTNETIQLVGQGSVGDELFVVFESQVGTYVTKMPLQKDFLKQTHRSARNSIFYLEDFERFNVFFDDLLYTQDDILYCYFFDSFLFLGNLLQGQGPVDFLSTSDLVGKQEIVNAASVFLDPETVCVFLSNQTNIWIFTVHINGLRYTVKEHLNDQGSFPSLSGIQVGRMGTTVYFRLKGSPVVYFATFEGDNFVESFDSINTNLVAFEDYLWPGVVRNSRDDLELVKNLNYGERSVLYAFEDKTLYFTKEKGIGYRFSFPKRIEELVTADQSEYAAVIFKES